MRSLEELEGFTPNATDGDVGRAVDFLLDDEHWTVRYLVVEPGSFLDGSQVLVSPLSFREVEWSAHRFHLALTKERVRKSPSLDVAWPVSWQHDRDFSRYYGLPFSWRSSVLWGKSSTPSALADNGSKEEPPAPPEEGGGVDLRSSRDVLGYQVQGSDEPIGHVEDFLVDEETWAARLHGHYGHYGRPVAGPPSGVRQACPNRRSRPAATSAPSSTASAVR